MLAVYIFAVSSCVCVRNGVDILRVTTGALKLTHILPTYVIKKQEPTEINMLKLSILFNIFKIFKIQKDEIHAVLNIVTALNLNNSVCYTFYSTTYVTTL